ncbi:aminotransferase class I/II-fold pyridoxal phosphate-dependent enzyme [Mycobacterium sp. 050134]|uniref:aminotransferase class I/II-fold pyridoxal phosphate-dependent enzyme n=1 Tax=Mycobacterium sp. 050134 TaxID=3096111 RepID=UPI002EDAD0CD
MDHPDVVRARDVYGGLDDLYAAAQLSNPLFEPHRGSNGATVHQAGRSLINFSSFSYLNLAADPRVHAAAKKAIDEYGTSASASRIVSGEIPLFGELETQLAQRYDVDAAVITPSGYLTNAAVLGYLLGSKDVAVCDSLVHSSVISGTRWAGCKRLTFRHNDPDSLEAVLKMSRGSFSRAMVILEGCYSMDGDIARLPELIAVARRHSCSIMIDEAHSFGVLGSTGRGIREHFDLPGDAVDIWMGTLSKALGSVGGFVAGNVDLVRALKYVAPGVSLFATGPAPSTIAAALEALRIIDCEPERVSRLQHNGQMLRTLARSHGFDTGVSEGTPIVPIIFGDVSRAAVAAARIGKEGVNVAIIDSPSVPVGQERLRLCATSDHTGAEITYAVRTLRAIVDSI